MSLLILIPAREGSKGLPNKNVKLLGDKELIKYSIDFANKIASKDDSICITSDDKRVLEIANNLNVDNIIDRPKNLSSDIATMQDVVLNALDYMQLKGEKFESILLLQPTSPFRNKEDFYKLKSIYENTDCQMATTVTKSKHNPFFNSFMIESDNKLKRYSDISFNNRQQTPKTVVMNGSMYLFKSEEIKNNNFNQFDKISSLELKEEFSIDIDTIYDWLIAEKYLNYFFKQ